VRHDQAGRLWPRIGYVPSPLYLRHAAEPYWLRILGRQRVVYLKYNQCLTGAGFQRLAARALAVLRAHPAYRLVVDLRDNLRQTTNALLIGQQAADPIDEFGNSRMLRLPHYGVLIEVTTAVINPAQTRYGIPDIAVAPALSDWLAGQDPVLAEALAYTSGPSPGSGKMGPEN